MLLFIIWLNFYSELFKCLYITKPVLVDYSYRLFGLSTLFRLPASLYNDLWFLLVFNQASALFQEGSRFENSSKMSSSKLSAPQNALPDSILDSSSKGQELPAAGDVELPGHSLLPTSALQSYQKAVVEFLILALGEDWTELDEFSLPLPELAHSSWAQRSEPIAWLPQLAMLFVAILC